MHFGQPCSKSCAERCTTRASTAQDALGPTHPHLGTASQGDRLHQKLTRGGSASRNSKKRSVSDAMQTRLAQPVFQHRATHPALFHSELRAH